MVIFPPHNPPKKGRRRALKSSLRDFVDVGFSEEQFVYISVCIWKREGFIIPQVFRGKKNDVVVRQSTQSLGVPLVNSAFV